MKQTYQYPDTQPGDEDVFSREPFIIWLQSPKTGEVFQNQVIVPLCVSTATLAGPKRVRGQAQEAASRPHTAFPSKSSIFPSGLLPLGNLPGLHMPCWESLCFCHGQWVGGCIPCCWHSLGAVTVWMPDQDLPALAQFLRSS